MNSAWKIISFAFVIRLMFLIAVPVEENDQPFTLSAYNDEQAHLKYILHYVENGSRPIQTHSVAESYAQGRHDFEYYQSPLYYRISAWIYEALPDNFRSVYILRFVNLVFGILTILTIGQILLLFSARFSAGGMIFLSVFAPMVLFNVTVTNDVLLWLFSALLIYYSLLFLENPAYRYFAGMILIFSAAMWTKVSALTLLPAILFALYKGSKFGKLSSRLGVMGLFIFLTGLLTLPLFLENYLYYGSIIPLSIGSGAPVALAESLNLKSVYLTINYMLHTFYFPFGNYWRGLVHAVVIIIMGLVSLGIIYSGLRSFRKSLKEQVSWRRSARIFLMLTLILAAAGTLWMSFRYHQGEARMAFIALPAIVYFFLDGSEQMLGKRAQQILKFALLFPSLPYLIMLIN